MLGRLGASQRGRRSPLASALASILRSWRPLWRLLGLFWLSFGAPWPALWRLSGAFRCLFEETGRLPGVSDPQKLQNRCPHHWRIHGKRYLVNVPSLRRRCSMDMWCLDGIGREIWEWEARWSVFGKYSPSGGGHVAEVCLRTGGNGPTLG